MANKILNEELKKAVDEQNLEEVKALLSAGADINFEVGRHRDTLLHTTKSVEITKELLLGGAKINATNMYRETPLHSAITLEKKFELMRELLKQGANVNAISSSGYTALNYAIQKGANYLKVVKELLKYGADINISNYQLQYRGRIAKSLDYAVKNMACAKLLIKYTLIRIFNKDYEKIIDLAPYKRYRNYSALENYLNDCVCEIVQMKTDKIKDGFPLYKFVKNNLKHILCNNQISVRLAKIDYYERYPIYNDIILDKIKPFLERAELVQKLGKIKFHSNLDMVNPDAKRKEIFLDYDSTYKITEYLSNDNLLNFIVAFGNSNKRAFQSLSSMNNLEEPDASNDTKRVKLD